MLKKYLQILLCFTLLLAAFLLTAPAGTYLIAWERAGNPDIYSSFPGWMVTVLALGIMSSGWMYRLHLIGPGPNLVRG